MFLRGHGYQEHTKNNGRIWNPTKTRHQSGNLGEIQGDSTRSLSGYLNSRKMYYHKSSGDITPIMDGGHVYEVIPTEDRIAPYGTSGTLRVITTEPLNLDNSMAFYQKILFDNSRIVPVDNEIRPSNVAVKYIIKVK